VAANRNVVPGEGIEDVGPVKVMLESGIELDDVLYTLRSKELRETSHCSTPSRNACACLSGGARSRATPRCRAPRLS
jgi:hypothetical protein